MWPEFWWGSPQWVDEEWRRLLRGTIHEILDYCSILWWITPATQPFLSSSMTTNVTRSFSLHLLKHINSLGYIVSRNYIFWKRGEYLWYPERLRRSSQRLQWKLNGEVWKTESFALIFYIKQTVFKRFCNLIIFCFINSFMEMVYTLQEMHRIH